MSTTKAPRFSYVKFDEEHVYVMSIFRREFEDIEARIEQFFADSRPKALALTALEEAYMWVGKAMRDKQVARNGEVAELPERSDV